ncbi:MAG: cystathionine gamma-synthase [Sphingobacteriales bacterium]|nr:cystathionine gamma-synthase [Sphingobacteriales bacterium]
MKFATKAIHAGIAPDPSTGAIMTPIFQTSTYVQESPGVHQGYEYGRTQNPTRNVLQENLAALEHARFGLCFSTGMGAIDAIAKLLQPGDEVISTNDLYGGTYRIFTKVFQKYGIKFRFVDMRDSDNVAKFLSPQTRLIWIETPTNPMLNIVDIEAIATLAHHFSPAIKVVVDNTFATPYLQSPMLLGADIVTHSATKYLGGHSDSVLGAIVCNDDTIHNDLKFIQNACGATPGPFDSFLILRGIKTLHLRMNAHCANAKKVAAFLAQHSKVASVNYPGFEQHPNHHIAAKQMRDFGGMVSFALKKDTMESATAVLSGTHLFSLAESLGGVESLIGHPATMTHASIPLEERLKTGVSDSLIRLSVGIEDIDDLIEDLQQALDKV